MTTDELLSALDDMKTTMSSVATGGAPIGTVHHAFSQQYDDVVSELSRRGIVNAIPYRDLWKWYARWKDGTLPSWNSRRVYVADIFDPIIRAVGTANVAEYEPTGWERVDRTISEARKRLMVAVSEEHFQAVGLLCREALISLAQAVFVEARHSTLDGVKASSTDARRMLEAYIAVEMGGNSNEDVRKHAKAALGLAVNLQHKRTAKYAEAAICTEATMSVVNVISIIAGRRAPPDF